MNTEEKQYNADEIQSQYDALRVRFSYYIDAVISPIEKHFKASGQSETAFIDFYKDTNFKEIGINEEAQTQLQQAKSAVKRLKSLIAEAASAGKALDSVHSLEEECQRADLMRMMAWSLDPLEIKKATDQAQERITNGQADGLFQSLYTQAETRRGILAEEQNFLNASGPKIRNEIGKLIAESSALDQAPIEAIQIFQASLSDLLSLTSSFTRFGVTEVMDLKAAGGEFYTKMLSVAQQSEGIREALLPLIDEYKKKAQRYLPAEPQKAAEWFRPVLILKDFLDNEHNAELLKSIAALDQEIQEKFARWSKADQKLKEVAQNLTPGQAKTILWDTFGLVCGAENDYPDHLHIDIRAEECVEDIGNTIALELSQHRKLVEPQWPDLEKELATSQDWQKSWLMTKDLPGWLSETEQRLHTWKVEILGFSARLMDQVGKEGSERRVKVNQLVSEKQSSLNQDYQSYFAAWNGYATKRKKIRAFILEIQGLIRLGEQQVSKSPYDEANNRFVDFIKSNSGWAKDAELERAYSLLSQYLNDADNLRNACESFIAKQWENCISSLAKIGEVGKIIILDQSIEKAYLDSRLAKGQARKLPAEEVAPFAIILRQLAHVNQAADRIETYFTHELYDELGSEFEQLNKHGHGDSPVVKDIREAISYEEKLKAYTVRKNFGDSQYLGDQKINPFAENVKAQYNLIFQSASGNDDWLSAADDLLRRFADLAKFNSQSLWTGRVNQMQADLRGSFANALDEWLASLYLAFSAAPKPDVQEAFHFVQTARQNGIFANLNPFRRRWVIYQYYLNQEGSDTPKEQIVKNWRTAVKDFPRDEGIIQKFRAQTWEWWLKELDETLCQAARGEDIKKRIEQLFAQDETAFEDLFTPVITDNGEKIKPMLDLLHPEIKERKASWKEMQQADEDLRNNPQNLLLILKSLRDFQKEKGRRAPRPEIEEKIAAISSGFVENELKLGSRAAIEENRMESVEHYLRALYMHPWEDANEWVAKNTEDILAYWEILNNEIQEFNETTGDIYKRSSEARILSARLEELRNCKLSFAKEFKNKEFKDYETRTAELSRKIQTLEFGKDLLRRLNPCEGKWNAATCPNQEETTISDAQKQLLKYVNSLLARFSKDNVQVVGLTETCEPMFEYLNALKLAIKTLRKNLRQGEAHLICMEDCGKIMASVSELSRLEADCLKHWEKWIGEEKIKKASRCYQEPENVYRDLKFTHQGCDYSFYSSPKLDEAGSIISDPFAAWVKDLMKYIKDFNLKKDEDTQEVELQAKFYKNEFLATLSNGMLDGFRKEYKEKTLLLGNFLILAYMEKENWAAIDDLFQTQKDLACALEAWFENRNISKITELRLCAYRDHLQIWADETQKKISAEPEPVVQSCQQIRAAIQRDIQKDNGFLPKGPVRQWIENADREIRDIQEWEASLLRMYQLHIERINQTTGVKPSKTSKTATENLTALMPDQENDTVVLDNITNLRLFYKNPENDLPLTEDHQQTIFEKLNIPLGKKVDEVYSAQYESRCRFFEYVEDCIQPQKAGAIVMDGQQ